MNIETNRQFKLGDEEVRFEKSLLSRIRNNREEKCAFEGEILGYKLHEELQEYVIVLKYPDGYYCISRQKGWFGPFKNIETIEFDLENKVSYVKGEFALTRN